MKFPYSKLFGRHVNTWLLPRMQYIKVKQSLYRPGQALRVQEVRAPRFQYNRQMKLVRLSALRTVRLYLQEIFLVLISVRGWVEPRATVRPEGSPTAPTRALFSNTYCTVILGKLNCQYWQLIKFSEILNTKSMSLYVHNRHIRFSAPRVVMRHNTRQWQLPLKRGVEKGMTAQKDDKVKVLLAKYLWTVDTGPINTVAPLNSYHRNPVGSQHVTVWKCGYHSKQLGFPLLVQ